MHSSKLEKKSFYYSQLDSALWFHSRFQNALPDVNNLYALRGIILYLSAHKYGTENVLMFMHEIFEVSKNIYKTTLM